MCIFNGRSAIVKETCPYDVITDASSKGFGGHLDNDWFFGT